MKHSARTQNEHIKPSKHYSQQTTDQKDVFYTIIHTKMGVRLFKREYTALSSMCDPKGSGITV